MSKCSTVTLYKKGGDPPRVVVNVEDAPEWEKSGYEQDSASVDTGSSEEGGEGEAYDFSGHSKTELQEFAEQAGITAEERKTVNNKQELIAFLIAKKFVPEAQS